MDPRTMEAYAKLRAWVPRFELRRAPCSLRVEADDMSWTPSVTVIIRAAHRDAPPTVDFDSRLIPRGVKVVMGPWGATDLTFVAQSMAVPLDRLMSEDAFFHWLRDACMRMIAHELDESIYVDGVRRFDPHKGEQS